ncbi:MAG: CHAT domain-containing protein, partial [Leptolyngbya sp. SIO1D8]|nr:CHAT domain-containing protein [Leptolyngbya sp. SIO1D8]
DLSTMMLLSRFYDYWRQDGLHPSEALHRAEIWVRDTTNGEKITYFERFMPYSMPQLSTDKMAGQVADFLWKELMLENCDERSFAHPFHWAAFTYVGV